MRTGRLARYAEAVGLYREPGTARLGQVANCADMAMTSMERLDLVESGDAHYRRLADEVRRARREIALEMYQIRADEVGGALAVELARAAQRGVRVRLLADSFGSARAARLLGALKPGGVEVCWYNPYLLGRRTHRKLIVIDGRLVALGGMNTGCEFSERRSGADAWRDLMAWFEGEAVGVLEAQLHTAWERCGGSPGADQVAVYRNAEAIPCAVAGGEAGHQGHGAAYAAVVDSASEELLLANPYFVPPRFLEERLIAARRRGVRVVIAIPRRSDVPLFKHAGRRRYTRLLDAGVEIWERCDKMVHAKVVAVDRILAGIGSVNLNRRSLLSNSETFLLTPEPGVVARVRRLVLGEAAGSSEALDARAWRRHTDRLHWAEVLAAPLAALL